MSVIVHGPRIAILLFLGFACATKLWGGYQPEFAISEGLFWAATILEIGLMVGLLIRSTRAWALIGCGVLAAVGIGIEFWGRGETCGCLGSMIRLTSAQHVLLNATLGALAVVAWCQETGVRSVPAGQPAESA
ncbi:MAG: hypothetical protein KDE27_24780 [Planctomycetes bacterium]|nr:hypothetical protein [Planctomycetota bacterium]